MWVGSRSGITEPTSIILFAGARHAAGARTAPMIRTLAFWFRLVAGSAGFALSLLYCALRLLAGRRDGVKRETARVMARLVNRALGIRVVVHGAQNLAVQPCVYVANHQSFLDYPILAAVFPDRTAVIGRASLRRIPVVGWLFQATGNLLIEREDPARAYALLDRAARQLRDGTSIWIFPEGTRAGALGRLLPFKRGAFHLARQAGVPLVPVVVSPLAPALDLPGRSLQRTVVRIDVLAPVPSGGAGDGAVEGLADAVRCRMQAVFEVPREARALHPARLNDKPVAEENGI